jgi:tetratricopeptide (TPR) repeat protein
MKKIMAFILMISFLNTTLIASEYYDKAERLYNRVEYSESLEALEDAISREDNDKDTLIKIYYLKAKIYVILGKEKSAKKQFAKLLFLNNNFTVSDDESPKIVKFFQETKKKFLESLTVKLEKPEIMFEPLRETVYKKRVMIKAIISSMNESRSAKIFYRKIGASKYLKADLTLNEGDSFEGGIPMPLKINRSFALEYYIGILDFSGKMIASYSSAEDPFILSVTLGSEKNKDNKDISEDSIFQKWWFWTIVGVVVVGGAGAGIYAATK